MKTIEKVYSLFVSENDARLKKPFERNGKIFATNGHVLIMTDKSNIDFKAKELLDIDPIKVVPEKNTKKVLKLNKAKFENLKKYPKMAYKGEDIDCEECNGTGDVLWEYKRYTTEHNCPICLGSGYSKQKQSYETGELGFMDNICVKINEIPFDIKNIYKLLEVQTLIKDKIYLLTEPVERKPLLASIGVFDIVIMPLASSNFCFCPIHIKI